MRQLEESEQDSGAVFRLLPGQQLDGLVIAASGGVSSDKTTAVALGSAFCVVALPAWKYSMDKSHRKISDN